MTPHQEQKINFMMVDQRTKGTTTRQSSYRETIRIGHH